MQKTETIINLLNNARRLLREFMFDLADNLSVCEIFEIQGLMRKIDDIISTVRKYAKKEENRGRRVERSIAVVVR